MSEKRDGQKVILKCKKKRRKNKWQTKKKGE